jgi:hypothetical protein
VSPDGGFGVSPDGGFGVSPEGELFKFEPHHLPPPPATHHTPHTIAKIPNIAHDTGKNIMIQVKISCMFFPCNNF